MKKIRKALPITVAVLALVSLAATPAILAEVKIDSNTFGGLRARAIGPAVMVTPSSAD